MPRAKPTDAEIRQAYLDACECGEYLASKAIELCRGMRKLTEGDPPVPTNRLAAVLSFGLRPLCEAIGDVLSNTDAVTDEDIAKTDPLFKSIHNACGAEDDF